MHKTTDYSLFKKLSGNRELDQTNLKKIISSLKTHNMLEFRPLLVNANMEVIDGQHRLEAAKCLGLEVYYSVKGDSKPMDMILINTAQKAWQLEDYIHFHACQGKKSYQDVVRIAKKNGISTKDVAYFLGISNGTSYKHVKAGTYDRDVEQMAEEIKERVWKIQQITSLLHEKTFGNKLYMRSCAFKKCLIQMLNNGSFNFDIFLSKLNLGLSRVHSCNTAGQYYDMFKAIYNYRNQEPIE